MTDAGSYPLTYTGYYDTECRPVRGVVPVEETIALHVNDQPLVNLMCTPTQLEELALGFLFNEGLIEALDDVAAVELHNGNQYLDIRLHHDIEMPRLRVFASGGDIFENVTNARCRVESDLRVTPQQVTRLMEEFSHATVLYRRAGGIHGAALAEGQRLLGVAEDMSRNNALDKIAGLCLRQGWLMRDRVLLITGRVSSEMVHKVARMGVPVVISRRSPTSLAVQLAQAWNITLIGYTRRRSFRVYTGAERVVAAPTVRLSAHGEAPRPSEGGLT